MRRSSKTFGVPLTALGLLRGLRGHPFPLQQQKLRCVQKFNYCTCKTSSIPSAVAAKWLPVPCTGQQYAQSCTPQALQQVLLCSLAGNSYSCLHRQETICCMGGIELDIVLAMHHSWRPRTTAAPPARRQEVDLHITGKRDICQKGGISAAHPAGTSSAAGPGEWAGRYPGWCNNSGWHSSGRGCYILWSIKNAG